jgi:methionyl aminopeptidase
VNEVVIHGIPGPYRLKEGDIIGLDVGVRYQGYCGDGAKTIAVGAVNADVKRLLGAAQTALEAAIIKAAEGNRIGDISNAIQTVAEENGFSVVREYVGHGIGSSVHEEPSIPNFGKAGTGLRIKTGMALAIETMVNMGGHQIRVLDDGWTVVTADGKPSAHFEHTVAVTENGPQVLTTL